MFFFPSMYGADRSSSNQNISVILKPFCRRFVYSENELCSFLRIPFKNFLFSSFPCKAPFCSNNNDFRQIYVKCIGEKHSRRQETIYMTSGRLAWFLYFSVGICVHFFDPFSNINNLSEEYTLLYHFIKVR